MRVTAPLILALTALLPASACPFEPVTALDDAFAIPSPTSLAEGALHYPGSESLLRGTFFVLARSVPFGVEDLAVSTVSAGGRFGGFGVSLSYSGAGFDLYGDEQEKAGCSLPLGGGLSAGARLTRTAVRFKGFGEAAAWSADIGTVWHPAAAIYAAASFENITGARFGESREPIEGRARASFAWAPSREAVMFASMAKVRRFEPSVSAGCTVEAARAVLLGAAAGTEPERIDFLAAVTVRGARFSYRGSFHRELGFSHGFSLGWGGAGQAERTE